MDTVVIDATYNTNRMKSELYCILGIIDGTGFPLSLLPEKVEIAHQFLRNGFMSYLYEVLTK